MKFFLRKKQKEEQVIEEFRGRSNLIDLSKFEENRIKKTVNKEAGSSFLQKARIFARDYWRLLFKSAAENHLHFQSCKKNPDGSIECSILFESYTALKNYQKRLRRMTLSASTMVGLVVISTLTVQLILPVFKSKAANYDWVQTSWTQANPSEIAEHNSASAQPQANWNYYSEKTNGIAADASGVMVAAAETTKSATTAADFVAGVNNGTTTSGDDLVLSKDFIGFAGDSSNVFALKSDGTVYEMGNASGATVPMKVNGLSDIISIDNFIAVDKNGYVWTWGSNGVGLIGDGNQIYTPYEPTNISIISSSPLYTNNVKAVKAFGYASTRGIIDTSGNLWMWGENDIGQFANGTSGSGNRSYWPTKATAFPAGTKIVDVSSSNFGGFVACDSNGNVWTWGSGSYATAGDGTSNQTATPRNLSDSQADDPLYGKIIKDVVNGGGGSSYAIDSNGKVWVWGAQTYGKLGNGVSDPYSHVSKPASISVSGSPLENVNISSIFAGTQFAMAIDSAGNLWAWGSNSSAQLGIATSTAEKTRPFMLSAESGNALQGKKFVAAAAIFDSAYGVQSDGYAYSWGRNGYGQLGTGKIVDTQYPEPIKLWTNSDYYSYGGTPAANIDVKLLSRGTFHGAALKSDGSIWVWGDNYNGNLGLGASDTTTRMVPTNVVLSQGGSGVAAKSVVANSDSWISSTSNAIQNTIALDVDGYVWTWGNNAYGQLGNNSTTISRVPIRLEKTAFGNKSVVSVTGAGSSSYAIDSEGKVWSWGYNNNGQLGDGSTATSLVPKEISSSSVMNGRVVNKISCTSLFCIAMDTLGKVYTWGYGSGNRLGTGNTSNSSIPVDISALYTSAGGIGTVTIVDVQAMYWGSLALDSDGKVWIWGTEQYGHFGNGGAGSATPITISGAGKNLSGVRIVRIASHYSYTLFLDSDGNVWSCGYNNMGQLGLGHTNNINVPTKTTISVVKEIAVGGYSSSVLKSDGSIWSWGQNYYAEFGDGTKKSTLTPQRAYQGVPSGNYYAGGGYKALGNNEQPIINLPQKIKDDGLSVSWDETLTGSGATSVGVQIASDSAAGDPPNETTTPGKTGEKLFGIGGTNPDNSYLPYIVQLPTGNWRMYYTSTTSTGYAGIYYRDTNNADYPNVEQSNNLGSQQALNLGGSVNNEAYGATMVPKMSGNQIIGYRMYYSYKGSSPVAYRLAYKDTIDIASTTTIDESKLPPHFNATANANNLDAANHIINSTLPVAGDWEYTSEIVDLGNGKYRLYFTYIPSGGYHQIAYYETSTSDGTLPNENNISYQNRKLLDGTPSTTYKTYGPRFVKLTNNRYRMYFTRLTEGNYWHLAYRDMTDMNFPQENGTNLEAATHFLNTGSSTTDSALSVFVAKIGDGGAYRMYYAYQNNGYWQLAYKDIWNYFGPDGQQHADCNGTNYCYTAAATVNGQSACSKAGNIVTCSRINSIHNGASKLRYRTILGTTSGIYTPSVGEVNFTHKAYEDFGPRVLHHFDGTVGTAISNYSTLTDASGHANSTTAINTNGTDFVYTAHSGTMTGLGQYATFASDDSFQIPLPNGSLYSNLTIESWFNANATYGTIAAINSGGIAGSGIGICTSGDATCGNKFIGKIVDKNTIIGTLYTDESYNDGQWHHGVLTYDGVDAKLYVDGIEKKKTTLNYALTGLTSYAKIGGGTGNHWGGYTGKTDETAIYDRALSASEVQAHYAGGSPLPIMPEATLLSSVYNTLQDANVMKAFKVFGQTPAGSSMKMQIRGGTTATPDSINWTKWCGLTSCNDLDSITLNESTVGQNLILADTNHPLRSDQSKIKQYFQYRLLLASDGQNSPLVDGSPLGDGSPGGVHVTYEVNGSPNIANFSSVSQDSNGVVQIGSFDALDADLGSQDLQLYFTADVGVTLDGNIAQGTIDNIILSGTANNLPYNRSFTVQIDQEQLSCTRSLNQSQLNTCTRGANGTTAASHLSGAVVWVVGSDNLTEGDQLAAEGSRAGGSWNIAGDLNADGIYIESARIRIVAHDGQTANQVSLVTGATSNTFTLDTKKPNVNANTSAVIDARRTGSLLENEATLTLNVSDDTNIRYKYSRTLNVSGEIVNDSLNGDSGSWVMTGAKSVAGLKKVIKLNPVDTIKTDTVYVQFIDDRNNKSDVLTVDIPERPTAMMIQDITNTRTDPDEVGLFVTWKTFGNNDIFERYVVERAMLANPTVNQLPADSDYVQKAEITNKAENYYRDNNVPYDASTDQHYYYRVYTKDKSENISYYSSPESDDNVVLQGIPNGTQDGDEGGGGPAAEPKIENVNLLDFATNQATITWTADQLSDSTLEYSATPGAYDTIVNVPTMIMPGNTHSVTLKNLDAAKTYYYRVKSKNGSNSTGIKEDAVNFHFGVLSGLDIVGNPMIEEVTNSTATIIWKTNKPSSSAVYYSDQKDPSNMALLYNEQNASGESISSTADSEGRYDSRVNITGLTEDKNYYFWVVSTLMVPNRNAANKNTIGGFDEYFSFRTTADHTAPVLATSDNILVTDEKAVLSWDFNENAQVVVHYKKSGDSDQTKNFNAFSKYGVVVLDNLASKSQYSYWLTATDRNGNTKDYGSSGSALGSFETLEKQVTHLPLVSVQNSVLAATMESAVVSSNSLGLGLAPTISKNAKLCYGSAAITSMDCPQFKTSSGNSTTHIFSLNGLTAGETYHYRVYMEDSENAANTVTTEDATFTTASIDLGDIIAPEKNAEPIVETFPNKANITVSANDDSIVFIEYKKDDTTDFATTHLDQASKNEYQASHTVTLTNLEQNKKYYFRVRFQDRKGNISTDETFYSFTTKNGPQMSNIKCQAGKNDLTFTWETDENSDTYVIYSENEDMSGYYRKGKDELKTVHELMINGLLPITTYSYQVSSKNSSGGTSVSDTKTCQTLTGEVDSLAPSITDVKYVFVSDKQALINWLTKTELSTSQVEYEKSDTKPNSFSQTTTLNADMVSTHNVLLDNLTPNATYYYRVSSRDSAGNMETSDTYSFKTLADDLGDDTLGMIVGKASSAPSISSASAAVSKAEGNAIVITWKTNKEANSLVAFKPEGSETYQEQGNSAEMVADHTVTLHDLSPNTTYTYYVKSIDALGNAGQSETGTFTTAASSTMFNVQVVDISYDSATISWETALGMTTQVEYGEGGDYDNETTEDTNEAKAHAVTLNGLKAGTTYNYRLKGKDAGGNPTTSSEYTFLTPAPPEVLEFKVDSITENKIKVTFKTNINTSAFVTLTNSEDEKDVHTQGDPNFNTEHLIEVNMLASGVTYKLNVEVRDEKGNSATKEVDDYTTAKDENAPKIDQIKSDTALTQNDKVQTIISWITDEPANAYLIYREGKNGVKQEVKVDDTYAVKHTAISTTFKPGVPYFFNVKSIDKSGNVAISSDYAVLTPKKKQNIIQIIINNFQDIFGWARR